MDSQRRADTVPAAEPDPLARALGRPAAGDADSGGLATAEGTPTDVQLLLTGPPGKGRQLYLGHPGRPDSVPARWEELCEDEQTYGGPFFTVPDGSAPDSEEAR